jgi:hypothetical protein
MNTIFAASSFYEILLIILVIILISNGILRRRNLQNEFNNTKSKNDISKEDKKIDEGEYVDYEIIKE